MIDAHEIAEHALETLHDLHGEGYLREQEEHLLMLFECPKDEVDIDLSLATGGDPV